MKLIAFVVECWDQADGQRKGCVLFSKTRAFEYARKVSNDPAWQGPLDQISICGWSITGPRNAVLSKLCSCSQIGDAVDGLDTDTSRGELVGCEIIGQWTAKKGRITADT